MACAALFGVMTATASYRLPARPLSAIAFAIAALAAATLAGAWFFELVLGLEPCPLCLDQRIPYYIAVPLGIVVGLAARREGLAQIARMGLFALGAVMLVGAGYGIYHSGVEWGLWEGPASCAASGRAAPVGDILSSLKATVRVVPCTEAAWRFLGLSLAGYNVLIAGGLAALAFWAALNRRAKNA
jgi:disulfide bond formation protein DsbB